MTQAVDGAPALGTVDDAGAAAAKQATAPDPDDPRKPSSPGELRPPVWRFGLRQAVAEFQRDRCTDLAAGLTYHSVLSVFPATIAVVSLLGVIGDSKQTTDAVIRWLQRAGQKDLAEQLQGPIEQITRSGTAGLALALGLLGALWSASGYIAAFGRAMNRIYEVDEGRPGWKLRLVNLAVTIMTILMATVVLIGLVVSGPIAARIGAAIGLSESTVSLWNVVKWPAMLILVMVLVAMLYGLTPNVRQPRFRWLSLGAVVAIVLWIVVSVGFSVYVSNFGSYNKTYGSLAGVIVFLLWLWITNVALLFGAEVDSEIERARQLQAGIPAEESLQLPARDTRVSRKNARKLERKIAEGRRLRLRHGAVPDRRDRPTTVPPTRADIAARRSTGEPGGERAQPKKPSKLVAALAFAALVAANRRRTTSRGS